MSFLKIGHSQRYDMWSDFCMLKAFFLIPEDPGPHVCLKMPLATLRTH